MPEATPTSIETADAMVGAPETPTNTPEPRQPSVPRQVVLAMAVSGAMLWCVWATHTIVTLRNTSTHFVKVELADLVREYVQREARSGEPPVEITARTASFLTGLNTAVAAHTRRGDVVLLGNAVVGGDIPDITATVRAEVYAHQPPVAQGAAVSIEEKPAVGKAESKEAGHGTNP